VSTVARILALPSVLIYTYLIAFGFHTEIPYWIPTLTVFFEVVYGIEIVLTFITSYTHFETNQQVISIKEIAVNYLMRGPFIMHFLAFIPWLILIDSEEEHLDVENE